MRHAARAIAVAEHQIGPRPLVPRSGRRRHGMAINQHGGAEIAMQPHENPPQGAVVGLVQAVDPLERLGDRNTLIVDFLRIADHARNRAEPAGHPHRSRIGERRQPAVEHSRIKLVRLAIDVDIAAREMRSHQRVAARYDAGDQFVDEQIFGAAQGRKIEPRREQEFARINAAAMRRIEQDSGLRHRPARCASKADRIRPGFPTWAGGFGTALTIQQAPSNP